MGCEDGIEFSYFLSSMKFQQRTCKIFYTNYLILSDLNSLPASKDIRFIVKTCWSTKPLKLFKSLMLTLENAMRPSGVPYYLLLYKRVMLM